MKIMIKISDVEGTELILQNHEDDDSLVRIGVDDEEDLTCVVSIEELKLALRKITTK